MSVFATLEPGTAAGKYSVIREIGRGGMGVVYLAEDTTLAREVAIKVLYPSLSTDTVFIDRFKQEARIVASILHPSIVRINSFETLPEGLAIDMEYVPGPSLGHMMEHEIFTPQLAVQVARDALEGLAVCHELGVVHRDIKPNNILLGPDGRGKLADFGLATAYATHLESSIYRVSSSGFFLGTPRFAPPEAWEGGNPLPNWDLYSLGLVLYEGLIGRALYTGATPLAIVKQLMASPVAPLRDVVPAVSPEFGAFVDRLVSHNPSVRPVDAPTALQELKTLPEFIETAGDSAPTVQVALRNVRRKSNVSRWARRARAGMLRGAAVVALVAAGAGAALWFAGGARSRGAGNAPAAPVSTRNVATQERLAEHSLLTAQDVLNSPKTEESRAARFYTATYMTPGDAAQAQRTERWMILGGPNGGARRVFGMSERFLMVAELSGAGQGAVTLKGNWASYNLEFGAGLQGGTIGGAGTWMVPNSALNIPIRLVNERDHTEESYGVAVALDESLATDAQFAYQLEREPLLQPLLFAELLPRHATWTDPLIALLPPMFGSTCVIPKLPTQSPHAIDGALGDAAWSRAYFDKTGRIGEMPGRPLNSGAMFRAVVNGPHLVMAFRYPKAIQGRWGVRVTLMPLLAGPLSAQTYMKVVRYTDREIEYHQYRGGVETGWDDLDWAMELASDDGNATCELAIPIASLKESVRPSEFSVWRMNAWIVSGEDKEDEATLAAWGYPDLSAIEHGAILRFENHVQ